jgi:hypothetical protein
MGGALLSPALPCATIVTDNKVWVKTGTYTIASSTANIATGRPNINVTRGEMEGYETNRGDLGAAPTLLAGVTATYNILSTGASSPGARVINFILDGADRAAVSGFTSGSSASVLALMITSQNMAATGFATSSGTPVYVLCAANNCRVGGFIATGGVGGYYLCIAYGAVSGNGFSNASGGTTSYFGCIGANTTANGFNLTAASSHGVVNCIGYGNAGHGFEFVNQISMLPFINCIAWGNTGSDFSSDQAVTNIHTFNCAAQDAIASNGLNFGAITLTADPFVGGASLDFTLNNTAGGGVLLRGLGYPTALRAGSTTMGFDVGLQMREWGFPIYGEMTGAK